MLWSIEEADVSEPSFQRSGLELIRATSVSLCITQYVPTVGNQILSDQNT